jgi:hypothetical protein
MCLSRAQVALALRPWQTDCGFTVTASSPQSSRLNSPSNTDNTIFIYVIIRINRLNGCIVPDRQAAGPRPIVTLCLLIYTRRHLLTYNILSSWLWKRLSGCCTSSIRGQHPLARGFYSFIVPQDASPGEQPNSLPQPLACFHEFRWALLEFLTLSVTGLLQTRFSGPWDDHGEALGADQSSAASR